MYSDLTVSNALCDQQSGFRKGHSTTTCLAEYLDTIYENMNNNKISGVLFLDLRKAFDTVHHHILLCKLEEIGLGQSYVDYIEAYLFNRTQVTKVNHAVSMPSRITYGVPQGSILGPLLFIIYINSLTEFMPPDVKTFLYADDTALVVNGSDMDEVAANLNEALHYAGTWFMDHCLSLNLSKTKLMVHGPQNKI